MNGSSGQPRLIQSIQQLDAQVMTSRDLPRQSPLI
jgi:hypothetical protein